MFFYRWFLNNTSKLLLCNYSNIKMKMITFERFSIKQKVMNIHRFFCAKHDLCRPLCIITIHPPSKILRLLSKTKICFTTTDDELKTYVRNQVWSGPLIHCFISPFCRLYSQIKGEKCSNKQRKTFLLNVLMQKLDWNWVSNYWESSENSP